VAFSALFYDFTPLSTQKKAVPEEKTEAAI
jgi:hypothetical protein